MYIGEIIIDEDSSDGDDQNISLQIKSQNVRKLFGLILTFVMTFRILCNVSDQAILLLLRFTKYLIRMIGVTFQIDELSKYDVNFPQTIYGCYSFLNQEKSGYSEYIACPSCHILYDKRLIPTTFTVRQEIPKCTYVEFPNHPQLRFRKPCDELLLSVVKKGGQKVELKPRRVYYYYGIKASLNAMLLREDLKLINLCKSPLPQKEFMADITDGRIWSELVDKYTTPASYEGTFLGILVNIDWFQPYKHISYSIGVIYAVIINLPRTLRYKRENVIIIGVIPGPKEPNKHMNSYLGPFVKELLEFLDGIWFSTKSGKKLIKCVMVGLSSDIPATRKAAGFVGHNATKACSRCLKTFPRVGDHVDCSGFDRETWEPRSHKSHCYQAQRTLSAQTKAARKLIEKESGARYSILFELPYYDAIRFANIDSMHNIFLGTAKHVMVLWKEREIIKKEHFTIIQDRVDTLNVPMDIGRIPSKIESAMAGLTADQWKNWTCIFSLYVLHDILPRDHLHCWWLFVQACSIVCQPIISKESIASMDNFLLEFCRCFEKLFGPESCTINLHLHCHLADCMLDYGPSQSTWCFGFERLNGVLGSTPTNKKMLQTEKTLINRFVQQFETWSTNSEFAQEVKCFFPTSEYGSVGDTNINSEIYIRQLQLSQTECLPDLLTDHGDLIEPIGKITEDVLSPYEVACLQQMYQHIFSTADYQLSAVSCIIYRFDRVKVGNKLISSKKAKSERSSFICAQWLDKYGSICASQTLCRPGKVLCFFKHCMTITKNGQTKRHYSLLAFTRWYKVHPEKNYLLSPITLWSPEFEPVNCTSFLPISRIMCRCAQLQTYMQFPERSYNSGQTVIIIPVQSCKL